MISKAPDWEPIYIRERVHLRRARKDRPPRQRAAQKNL